MSAPGSPGEFATTLRAWLREAARADPHLRRFGARRHRYQLAPPLAPPRLDAIEATIGQPLPDAYRRFVGEVGGAGAGPFHGLWPLDHPTQLAHARGAFAPSAVGPASYRGVVALGHVGCGQLALLVIGGAHAGQVWIDARACAGTIAAVAPDFDAYYLAWVQALAHNQLVPGAAAPGACPLPRALSHYLGAIERRAGIAPGALDGEALRAAFAALPPAAIRCEASGDDPYLAAGSALDPCPTCAVMLARLEGVGLAPDRVAEGQSWPPDDRFSVPE